MYAEIWVLVLNKEISKFEDLSKKKVYPLGYNRLHKVDMFFT